MHCPCWRRAGFRTISRTPRNQFLGEALAGFALFFLGLSIQKTTLESAAGGLTSGDIISPDYGLPAFFMIGLIATVLTSPPVPRWPLC